MLNKCEILNKGPVAQLVRAVHS